MKIAVSYDHGTISQYFGHSETFKIYNILGRKVVSTSVFSTFGCPEGELASLLYTHGVDVLICGHIANSARLSLAESGITLYDGMRGDAKEAVTAFLNGSLDHPGNFACAASC